MRYLTTIDIARKMNLFHQPMLRFPLVLFCLCIAVSILFPISAKAQTDSFPLKPLEPYANRMEGRDAEKLLGQWESLDSTHHRIRFQYFQNAFYMYGDSIQAAADLFSAYSFTNNYTDPLISAHGCMTRWPPSYCYIQPIQGDILYIDYGMLGSEPYRFKYKRVANIGKEE